MTKVCQRATTVFIGLILCSSALRASDQDPERMPGYDYVLPGWYRGLDTGPDITSLRRGADELDHVSLPIRLSVGFFLVKALGEDREVEMPGYSRAPGTHSLSRTAGRAAYFLEHAFPITLPTISETTSAGEIQLIQEAAERQYNAYRAGVMTMVETYKIGDNPQQLADQYRESIYVGVKPENHKYQFFGEGEPAFKQMLHEFFPIGKKLSDLETIMGAKARASDPSLRDRTSSARVTGVFKFYYTTGMFGESYFFLVEDGIITAMNTVSHA